MAAPVNLDHNATTPVAPEVAEAMWPHLTEHCGNPSSDSPSGRAARRAVEQARERVAALIAAEPDEIVFTSGGTEANNLAVLGAGAPAATRRVVTSCVEHPATRQPVELLRESGWSATFLGVDAAGRIDPDEMAATTARARIGLATLILAQNEVGTVQPVAQFAGLAHHAGALVHTDAAQAVGKIAVDVDALDVDLLSVAGHKLYAPKGVGALYVRRGTPIAPVLRGAGQERGLRPGTENVASVVGLGRAAELARDAVTDEPRRQRALRERLWEALQREAPGLVRLSPREGCLPGTLMVARPGTLGRDVLAAAPGVEASTGSACHAGVDSPAETLLAMGVERHVALAAVRLSLGRSTTAADIDRAARALGAAFQGAGR